MATADTPMPSARAGPAFGFDLALPAILLATALLRFVHLGYSHFQGDEIKALYPPGAPFPGFLMEQSKGPLQFLLTRVVRQVTGSPEEWVARVPFALASWAAVLIAYRLAAEAWGRGVARLSAALLGGCGLLVGLGRIVQYQSLCLLLVALTAWLMLRWLRSGAPAPLYGAFASFALAVLAHYDALTFLPALLLLAFRGLRAGAATARAHLAGALLLAVSMAGSFYVPFVLQPRFGEVLAYLAGRVAAGEGLGTFGSTGELLGLYLPPLYLQAVVPFLLVGLCALARRWREPAAAAVLSWFAVPFGFYMLLGGDPRSHVYAYFTPGLLLAGYGLEASLGLARGRALRATARGVAWTLVVAFAAATYMMMVDHGTEHPWERKALLGQPLPNLESRRLEGVFGFPYRRGLEQVGERFRSGRLAGTYASNERDVMADYYFHAAASDRPDYYVHVHRPLSLDRELPAWVAEGYRKVDEVMVGGRRTIDVYERVTGVEPAS